LIFHQNLDFWRKFLIFNEIFDFWSKFRFLTKNSIFDQIFLDHKLFFQTYFYRLKSSAICVPNFTRPRCCPKIVVNFRSNQKSIKNQSGIFIRNSTRLEGQFRTGFYIREQKTEDDRKIAIWNYYDEWIIGPYEYAYQNIYQESFEDLRLGCSNELYQIFITTKNMDFWPKYGFLAKIWIFDQIFYLFAQITIFGQNLDFLPKFGFFAKIWIFCQNLDFLPKFGFFAKIWIFFQNLDFWKKIRFLVKIWIFEKNFDFWSKFGFFSKICFVWPKFGFLAKLFIFDQILYFCQK